MTPSQCPKCGNPLRKNAAFCGYCGADIHAPVVKEPPAPLFTPEPALPEGDVCRFCGKPLRTGARFCAGCGKAVTLSEAVENHPDGEAPLIPPTPEEAAPLAFPLSGLQQALEEPEIEFDEHTLPEPSEPGSDNDHPMPVAVPSPAKQAQFRKIWIGLGLLVVLGVLAVIILPGLFGSVPDEVPIITPATSLPVVASPTASLSTTEPTTEPTPEPTLQPTTLPPTATFDTGMLLQPLNEDFSSKQLASDWIKTGTVGAVIETFDESRGGVLRLNSDMGKGLLTYSPPFALTNGINIQFTLVSTSSAFAMQLFDSETQVAIGAVPLMSLQIKKETLQLVLVRADSTELTIRTPQPLDGKQAHQVSITVSLMGAVTLGIDGAEVFTTGTNDLMTVPTSKNVRLAMTGSAVIDDLKIQLP